MYWGKCRGFVRIISVSFQKTDFSVVRFRPDFMLGSEEHPMKTHKNQRALNPLFPPDSPWRVLNQGTHHGVWGADAFAVTQHGTTLSDVGLQLLEKKVLSRGIIEKSAPIRAEIAVRKSQIP